MPEPSADFPAILRILKKHEVDFIVVGGVAAVLSGAPISTFDLDIVHRRDPENVARLMDALDQLRARYRAPPAIAPDASRLLTPGHQLLMTRLGPLDVLGMVGRGRVYEQLVDHTGEMRIGRGLKVLVLDLKMLIRVKEETGQDKDNAVLPVLRRTLAESERYKS